jgi:hypothetical protein
MQRYAFLLGLWICVATAPAAAGRHTDSDARANAPLHIGAAAKHGLELTERAAAIRATRHEMKFNDIPWVTDLFEGFRLAEAERRPVFLYLITGDPLTDC